MHGYRGQEGCNSARRCHEQVHHAEAMTTQKTLLGNMSGAKGLSARTGNAGCVETVGKEAPAIVNQLLHCLASRVQHVSGDRCGNGCHRQSYRNDDVQHTIQVEDHPY